MTVIANPQITGINNANFLFDSSGQPVGIINPDGSVEPYGSSFVNVARWRDLVVGNNWDAAFQAAAAEITARGSGTLFVPRLPGVTMELRNSVFLPRFSAIEFQPGAIVHTRPGGTFTANFLFLINTTDGVNWVTPFPKYSGCEIRHMHISNSANPSNVVIAVCLGVSGKLLGCRTDHCHGLVRSVTNYLDQVSVERAYIHEPQGSNWHIDLTSIGDGWSINQVHSYLTGGVANTVRLNALGGGVVTNSIGGNYQFRSCYPVTIDGMHNETGFVEFQNSGGEIRNSIFWCLDTPRIRLTNTGDTTPMRSVSLRNVVFSQFQNDLRNITQFDVEISGRYVLTVEDCYRQLTNNGNLSTSQLMGIQIQDELGAPLTAWNDYSWWLSQNGRIERNKQVRLTGNVQLGSGAFGGPFSLSTPSSAGTWSQPSATYHYGSQLIIDRPRMLGKSGGTASITATNGGNGVLLPISWSSRRQQGWIRLYRGTSAGQFDSFVDVPMVGSGFLYDSGSFLNSFPWQSRTVGGVDALTDIGDGDYSWRPLGSQTIQTHGDTSITVSLPSVRVFNTPLTANRTVTLAVGAALNGEVVRVVRTAASTGASTLTVQQTGGTPSRALAVGQFCEFTFDGTNWVQTSFGSL